MANNLQMKDNKLALELIQEPFFDNPKFKEYCGWLRQKYNPYNKILLIQSPQFLFESLNVDVIKNRGYYAYPPTGLQCVAKSLLNSDLDLKILDLNYEFLKRIINGETYDAKSWLSIVDDYLKENSPSIIGISCLTANGDVLRSAHPLTSLLNHLRSIDKHIVIVGGPTPTSEYESYLGHDLCHFVVSKEGETKMQFLIESLYGRSEKEPPTSGIYFKFNGIIEETRGNSSFISLSGNLIETYGLISIENYYKVGCLNPYTRMAGQNKMYSVFQLNRGCKANCKFCDVTKFMGRGTRSYQVDELIGEITYLAEKKGVRHLEVLDDDFIGNRTSVTDFLRKLVPIREKYGITWSANNGLIAASITEEIMDLIRDSGCIGFNIGIESGNHEMLIKVRKPATLDLLRKKALLLNNYPGLFIGAYYILGLFGEENFGQMMDTFRFAAELKLDWSSISTFQVTSKETAEVEKFKAKFGKATEFKPSKDTAEREIGYNGKIFTGLGIFEIDKCTIPSPEQIKEIWFAFNLILNYINNKNLQENGNPLKLSLWLESLQVSYPKNPYISLFAGLAHTLAGDKEKMDFNYKKTERILSSSEYWANRFNQFHLSAFMENLPKNPIEVYRSMEILRGNLSEFISP